MLGIEENNIAVPNGHQTELKSGRKGSPNMRTLFTKSPISQRINTELLERFGRSSNNNRKKIEVFNLRFDIINKDKRSRSKKLQMSLYE